MTMLMDSEMAVIGAIMAVPGTLAKAKPFLQPHYFKEHLHEVIYQGILQLDKDGKAIDPITVCDFIKTGDRLYVMGLAENVPTALHVETYAEKVRMDYLARRLKDHYRRGEKEPEQPEIRAEIKKLWTEIEANRDRMQRFSDIALRYYDGLYERMNGKYKFFETGFRQLDESVSNFREGDVLCIGARTSVGKTSLMLKMAANLANSGKRVLMVSGEMTTEQLLDRIVAMRSKLPLFRLRKPFSKDDIEFAREHLETIKNWNLNFLEGGKITMARVEAAIESASPEVVVIDYIQRFQSEGKIDTRASFFSDIANGLKAIAMEKKLFMIFASQINRSVDVQDRAPTLSDLKESGGIEEASDVVMLLHRLPSQEKGKRNVDFLVEKSRNGFQCKIHSVFEESTTEFIETLPMDLAS